ncbi:hypothetical protein [Pedobacter steynii]|nr:hypothetical protein [Pedobacter steynii]
MIPKYVQAYTIAVVSLCSLTSCNKEIPVPMAVSVSFHGYNLSEDQLVATFDTVVYDKDLIQPNSQYNFSKVYPYPPGKTELNIQVKNKKSGKELLKKTLSLSSGTLEFFFPLVYFDNKVLEVTPPVADPETNKLGFYIRYKESNEPIDIILYKPQTGERVYLAESVVPGTWVYTNYVPTAGFLSKNDIQQCVLYFMKSGTTDQWAFNGDEYASKASAGSLYIPHMAYNFNKVQPYFITPSPQGYQTDVSNMFPNPKEY